MRKLGAWLRDTGGIHAPMLGANATGQEKMKKPMNELRYTTFRPEEKLGVWWESERHTTNHAPRIPAQQAGGQFPDP